MDTNAIPVTGRRLDLSSPQVMGILNITPDSFYDGGVYTSIEAQLKKTGEMLGEGASMIDIGAVSTRPGAKELCEMCELDRLIPSLKAIRYHFPGAILSVDTRNSTVAHAAVEEGADMINDISGGRSDDAMFETIALLKVPYILMHMKGTPESMQDDPVYGDVVAEVSYFLEQQSSRLREIGGYQILVDPGFGFGKTVQHNAEMLRRLKEFKNIGYPLVVGLSRKSMIWKSLGINPAGALNGTTVLNTIALLKGADILRVHDVKEAVETIRLVKMITGSDI
jgi:dihydropteroate synthase